MKTNKLASIGFLVLLFLIPEKAYSIGTVAFADGATSNQAESAGTITFNLTVTNYDGDFNIAVTKLTSTAGSGDASSPSLSSIAVTANGTYPFTVTITEDTRDEEDETYVIQITGVFTGNGDTHTMTINDNDDAPTMDFSTTAGTDTEDTGTHTVTVSLTAASERSTLPAYTIAINGAGTSMEVGNDYSSLSPTSYTFNSGSTSDNFSVTIIDDPKDEDAETIKFTITSNNAVYAALGANTAYTLTVSDNDDPPNIQFNTDAASASEGNSGTSSKTITVDLSAASGKNVSCNYSVSGTAITGGTDHDLDAGTVSISAGATSNTIGFDITGEAVYENNETIIVTLTSPTNSTIGTNSVHTYTINNDDSAPTIEFSAASTTANEATTTNNITVKITGNTALDATADYALSGTATSADYILNAGTVTVPAGNNTTQDISITIVNDDLYEDDETVILTLSNPGNSTLGTQTTHTYTIDNVSANDDKPSIKFNSSTGTASEATTAVNIQVDLSAASGLSSSVDYTVAAGSPVATGSGTDYTLDPGTATIAAGETSTNIAVTVVNDVLDEDDEKFVVTIANPNTNVTLGTPTTHTYTIQDNDDPPTVQFNATSSSATEGTNGTLTVDFSTASGRTATVNYTVQTSSSTATGSGTDYTLADGTLTFSAGETSKTITVTGADDALDEDDETVVVLLSSPSSASLGTNTTHTFTINDNDATPSVQFNATTTTGAEATASHTVQVDLSAVAGRDVSVPYTVAAGTPAATGGATDYTLADGTLTITAGSANASISVSLTNDTTDEWDEKFVITLSSSPTNATIGTNTTNTFTITDDDAAPTINFSASTGTVNENVTPKDIAVVLSAASEKNVAVYYTVTAGSPAATGSGTDYTLANDSLRITAGNSSANISPVIVNDALDENDEKLVVTLTGVPDNTILGTTTTHTLTIVDNDDPPLVAFSSVSSSGNESTTPASLAIALSTVSGLDMTVNYALTGTATGGGVDFTLADGTASISAGDSTATLSLVVVDDFVVEDDETTIATLSSPSNATLGTNTAHTYTILNDDSPPADFTVGTITTVGGTVATGYWNSTNTSLTADVPVANNDTLVGGTIQLRAKKGALSYEDLAVAYTIVSSDKATSKSMSVTAAEFEGITGFAEDSVITIAAIITDKYGNSTTGTASATTVTIDQTAPTAFTLGAVTVTGGTVVSGYWNSTNSGVSAVVPIQSTDASLVLGSVRLQTKSGDTGTWTSVGISFSVSAAEVTAGTKTITADSAGTDSTDIEEISGIGDGKQLIFRALLSDVAGNSTNSTESTSKPLQDQTVPTITNVTASSTNKAYTTGDTILITLESRETVDVTQFPKLTLETGSSDGQAVYSAGSGSSSLTMTYVVSAGHTSSDLDYLTTSPLTLDGGTVRDGAGNDLSLSIPTAGGTGSLQANKDIVIDTELPSVTLTYDDPDNLVRFEDGILTITATFTDSIMTDSIPRISVDIPQTTTSDISNVDMTRSSSTVYTYPLSLIDGVTGTISVSISARDKALNAIVADSVFNSSVVVIDNTDPAAFTTGSITLLGTDQVTGWINDQTDSLKIVVPVGLTDESLLLGGDVNIEMRVPGKMTSTTWQAIPSTRTTNPGFPADSIQQLETEGVFYRSKADIVAQLTALGLTQGDTIITRAVINDAVGNSTNGTQSATTFVFDTLEVTVGSFLTDAIYTVNKDTVVSSDTVYAVWKDFTDPTPGDAAASGINRIEYAIQENAGAVNGFVDWTSLGTDTTLLDTFTLTHNSQYQLSIRAVDVAGNTSALLTSNPFRRWSSPPVLAGIDSTAAYEDIPYSHTLVLTDLDLTTINSDTFSYAVTKWLVSNPDSITDLSVNTTTGEISWTPTPTDTGLFEVQVIVRDRWDKAAQVKFSDTTSYKLNVIAVNDTPVVDLSALITFTIQEDYGDTTIYLTPYATDEDNIDSTELTWSAAVLTETPDIPGFPLATRLVFGPGTTPQTREWLIDTHTKQWTRQGIAPTFLWASQNQLILAQVDSKIGMTFTVSNDSTVATIRADSNYYGENFEIVFYADDPSQARGIDTLLMTITPQNDPPRWATSLKDSVFEVRENDTIKIDFASLSSDVDDTLLTFTVTHLTNPGKFTVLPSRPGYTTQGVSVSFTSDSLGDSVSFAPQLLWSDSSQFQVKIADQDTSALVNFVIDVIRVPRPNLFLQVVQNNAFTNFYEVILTDLEEKSVFCSLEVQSKVILLDTVGNYTYVGHSQFTTSGTYTFDVFARGVVGDTSKTWNLGLAAAKTFRTWTGSSPDGLFRVRGPSGSVAYDQSILMMDSTLFGPYFNDRATYLLGKEQHAFLKPVQLSIANPEGELAIYQRTNGVNWQELPSLIQNGTIQAYTDRMGYFRLGLKTLVVPGMTSLHQNYPNPFNSVTTIVYDLGFVDGPLQQVNLSVFNLLGQEVKTLVNETQGIGRYTVRWDGKDEGGTLAASGIYFVRLLTHQGRLKTKKIMLLR